MFLLHTAPISILGKIHNHKISSGNNKMKCVILLAITNLILSNSFSQTFELVESIPIETNLDNPDIRNTQDVWIEMIQKARLSLDIEQFYISNKAGEPLEDVLNAIIEASERGVQVRIIVDSRMAKTYPQSIDSLIKHRNIKVRTIDFGKLAGGVQHAKFFIVDKEELFLGSQNFDWRALKHIHELGLRIIHSEAVRFYLDIFNLDWELAKSNDRTKIKNALKIQNYNTPFRTVDAEYDTIVFFPTASPKNLIPDTSLWDEQHIVQLLESAKTEVLLQFLSYSPLTRDQTFYPVLDNALRNAATRGVQVKMIVSDWTKERPEVDYLKSLTCIPNIEVKFSTFPEWTGGYIPYARVEHSKFIVVDATTFWLGTSNAEKSYFHTSRNVSIIIKNKKLATRIREIFYQSWDSNYTELINPAKEYQPKRYRE